MPTGFGQKQFLAKVMEIEIESKKEEIDILATVHDRSGELKGQEDTLVIPKFTPGVVLSMPITGGSFANGSVEDTINLAISDEKGYPILVGVGEQLETNINLRDTRAWGGVQAHKTYRNGLLLAAIADATKAGQRLKKKDSTDNKLTDADFLAAATALNNAKAPFGDRYAAIGASDYADVVSIPSFISRDKMGDKGEVIPLNLIGMIRGFKVILVPDSEMPVLNASTGAVAQSGKDCAIFYQRYAVAYGRHAYQMLGPEMDVGSAKEKWNLYAKQGKCAQNDDYAVTVRDN